MRMNPLHVHRKFWWELIFLGLLLFLLAGARSQAKLEVVAAALAALPPVVGSEIIATLVPLASPSSTLPEPLPRLYGPDRLAL